MKLRLFVTKIIFFTLSILVLGVVYGGSQVLSKKTVMTKPNKFAYLEQKNRLIGMSAGQEAEAVNILSETCRRRVEYVATPLEGAPFHLPLTTPVTVGGATVFTLEVERYEVI